MRYSRLREKTLLTVLCLIATATSFNVPVAATSGEKGEASQAFQLRVQFGMPGKERVEINIKISQNVPFGGAATDSKGNHYDIGGMLLPHKKGKYRLVLTALNWDDLIGERFGTLVPEMNLNQTIAVCDSDGIIHNCIAVTLLPAKNENNKR